MQVRVSLWVCWVNHPGSLLCNTKGALLCRGLLTIGQQFRQRIPPESFTIKAALVSAKTGPELPLKSLVQSVSAGASVLHRQEEMWKSQMKAAWSLTLLPLLTAAAKCSRQNVCVCCAFLMVFSPERATGVFLAEVSCWMQVEGLSSFALVSKREELAGSLAFRGVAPLSQPEQ